MGVEENGKVGRDDQLVGLLLLYHPTQPRPGHLFSAQKCLCVCIRRRS